MQQVDDPPSLPVGTEVSAKYKGAFCEAKVSKVVRNIKVKVAYKHNLGSGIVSDDAIKSGLLRVGSVVEVKHPDRKDTVEATVTKIQDCSQYTVVFDDGDITTLRRTALCLKSGRHFNESETLDQLPLTHPEHFGNPVVGGRRGRRRHINEDSSEEEDESDTKEVVNEKEEHIGKVVCVETESKKKDKEKWFPGLVVSPNAQATVRIRVKDEYLVRSFKDGRYYTVPKKEATEFTREAAAKQDGPAVQAALEFLDSDVLPPHWDRDALFGLSNSSSEDDGEMDSDSSDDEPREEKDRFVAQLYKYMDDRGTPLNKVPSIQSRDVDLYRLFRAVQKRGGYNRVTAQNQWKSIAIRLGFTPVTISVTNLVKQAYKKFLQPYGEFHRKLGCSMLMTPRNSNRSKGRSLVRANSVASPKPAENVSKDINSAATANVTPKVAASTQPSTSTGIIAATVAPSSVLTIQSATEESENTSESSVEISKNKRKTSVGSNKVKGLVEKYEEKSSIKDEGDVPLSKIKAAAASSRVEEKETTVIVKDVTSTMQVTTSRDGSPTGLPGSSKKEKYQKKPTPQSDEKRGKRKKDEVSVEKVDVGDFIVEIGDKLKVYYHEKKVTYEAKVIEITLQRGTPMYLVHYTGWNNRYDEWVPRERIAENLTKGSKQKGRTSSTSQNEKSKENPPKPPTAAQLSTPTSGNLSSCIISSSNSSSKTPTSARRGRGRSDSLPPRSTTPSSVASNSSRTKSPAASTLKRRPARTIPTNNRRTSANASDVSMPSESDTDSDEPVRRPTRGTKDTPYKSGSSVGKSSAKNKLNASAGNSQTDTDEDDEDDDGPPRNRLGSSAKGRDYDLNQIRSELKGFQDIKSPSPVDIDDNQVDTKDASTVKSESNVDTRPSTSGISIKAETKQEPKEEPTKLSTTDISSETDSFADDDSQSSDKTTTLENMTKKFQQKITADKQRALEKQLPSGKIVAEKVPLSTKTHIVEKIIKDSLAEKRQESLKAKPIIKEETKLIKIERDISNTPVKGGTPDAIRTSALIMKDEDKNSITPVIETKPGIIAPARFGTGSVGKYTSVIVEKPLSVVKKTEPMNVKKFENPKKQSSEATSHQMKKASEATLHKDIIKIEPPAACSPSSSSSSCSSSSSSSTSSVSSRSLPDMSKLDISGSSSTSSTTTNKDGKLPTAVIPKPISPDIYEFKDPEPFEYEMRKSTLNPGTSMSSVISNMSITTTASGSIHQTTQFENKRKPVTKISTNIHQQGPNSNSESSVHIQSPISAFVNRKKRGSPMKESASEKSKQFKIDEKQTSPIVLEAKLSLRSSAPTVLQATASTSKTSPTQNKSTHAPVTSNTPITNLSNKSIVVPANLLTPQKNEHFDALRKSPSFNLNINALNEELAQTVQETTRALTDVLQTPPPPPVSEITPTKSEPSSSSSTVVKSTFSTALPASPKLTTPPNAPPPKPTVHTAGSPFIETRKDLSNVFELSSNENEGTGSTGGHKDNKFELENVKILLSASASGFDVDPVKFENKPTSIADKVLKAISQKKEEVENKNKEMKNDLEKDVGSHPAVEPEAPTNEPIAVSSRILQNTQAPTTSVITEPLKIVTDLPNTSSVLCKKDPSIEKITGGLSSQLSMRPLLASPDSKLGILESITVKNNDLSETIQKLECAIQKKTPVSSGTSLAAASPSSTIASAPPTTFSDDSMDSTDSERRLVIEDEDEPNETQKSPHAPLPHSDFKIQTISTVSNTPIKIDPLVPKAIPVGSVVTSSASITIVPSGSTSTIPLKIATPGKANTVVVTSSASITSNLVGKLHANTSVILTTKPGPMPHPPATKPQQHPISTPQQSVSGHAAQSVLAPIEVKKEEHIGHLIGQGTPLKIVPKIQNQPQRTSTVVPIVLPDIPVSVVVASSAVPSVVAAAQAAAAAAQQTPSQSKQLSIGKTALSTTSTQMITSQATTSSFSANSASLKTFENAAAIRTIPVKPSSGIISSSQTNINEGGVFTPPTSSSSSVFFIDRTELRPDDGVKPIEDYSHSSDENPKHDKIRGDPKSDDTSAGNAGGSIDANNDSINLLLCEETIPGSPAPAFGKEESVHRNSTHSSDDKGTDYEQGGKDIPTSTGLKSGATEVNPTPNSSPNDSASQDESSEDIKKNVDLEHEISPRKRRRTRKQSEMMAIINEHQTKRRRPLVYAKKNTAGSDSDDNSDTISQRSTTSARHQQQMQQTSSNGRQCPYNFLIQLDPSLNPDQRIAVLLKQIQDLRKTYSMIKGDLASIDRRRKKLRRREREKKQQNQQQIKIA